MLAIPRAIPVRARPLALGLPLLLTGLLTLGAVPAQAAPDTPSTVAAVNPADRSSVAAAYRDVYLPAMAVQAPAPAADLRTTCDPASTPAALQDATRDLVNYFRGLSRVPPVTFDAGLSRKAQKAALIGYANGTLSHAPSSRATCWSPDGAEAAASSNLALGYPGAGVVQGYMDDAGAGNAAAGHRWWLQRPHTTTMGNGAVGSANALWVSGGGSPFPTGPLYTSWPSAGYLPGPLEPRGRWSFTAWDPDYDLSRATVAVTGPDGPVALTQAPVDPTFGSLVFEVGALDPPRGPAARSYAVTVSGILKRGEPVSPYRYTVSLFDPEADLPLEATATTRVSGTPEVGRTLTANPPTWSLPGAATAYQWFRGGTAIPGATGPTLLLTPADTGSTLRVTATGSLAGKAPAVASSTPTVRVTARAAVEVTATSPDQGRVQLDVTVTAQGEPAPSGTAEVRDGGEVVASGVPVVAGRAAHTLTGVPPGDRTYTVRFLGTGRVSPATSEPDAVTVGGPVRAELRVGHTSPAPGRLSLVVDVTAAGERAPDGRLEVREGGRVVASPAVAAGRATWTARGLRPGDHAYTLAWLGSARVAPATVTTVATVRDRAAATVRATPTSPSVGVLTVAVTVTAAGGTAPAGTVTITEGSRTVASGVPVVAGKATWTGRGLTSGRHTYTLAYSGSTAVAPARTTLTATVKAKAAPVLTLRASSPSSRKVSLAVQVQATGQPSPGGTVTVKEGSTTRKSGLAVTRGAATWTASGVTAGRHTYTVVYSGTSQVSGGTKKITVTVRK